MKKAVVSWGLAIALALTLAVGGSTVAAQPAEAYSGSYDYYTYAWCEIWYYKWKDYNWWEETFQWKRDGYVRVAVERIC